MAKSCADCIRGLMIFFNFLFILFGLAIVGLGVYLLVSGYISTGTGELSILAYPCIGLTILGIIPVFLAVCGCWGAMSFNRCCLGLYFTFLLFVFAAEIATGIAGVVHKESVREGILKYLKAAVDSYKPEDQITSLDLIQVMFHCCGVNGVADYGVSPPASCCGFSTCDYAKVPSCQSRTEDIENRTLIVCAVIIALALIQLVGLIFSMILCCAAKDRRRRPYYEPVHT